LASLGITVNCRILPEVDVAVMRRYTRAELAVLFDTSLYDSSYREIVGDIELPSIRPTAPYGVRHTRQWLWEVASSLGRSREAFEAAWDGVARSFDEEWARLRKQAVGYRLGFVVDEQRLQMFAEPRLWMGIPILDVLREMGFGLELLVRVGQGRSERLRRRSRRWATSGPTRRSRRSRRPTSWAGSSAGPTRRRSIRTSTSTAASPDPARASSRRRCSRWARTAPSRP
jgi:hypothetical protein